jgi:8-amino-7-oxononanoate synthase
MKEEFLQKKLNERIARNAFRELRSPGDKIDFCSNDYLGIVKNNLLSPSASQKYGSTGSRLLAGNYSLIEETEKQIAIFHQAEAALIFNSGYDANLGLLSSVPQKGDTILYDYLSHASLRDGIRLSFATAFSFAHNDMSDLEAKLKKATGNVFVVTESVFSMDGDLCLITELVNLCDEYKANLIIDEAHATGVVGNRGEGLVQSHGFEDHCFARIHTFGKALGVHGAVILGSGQLRNYLINFARSFIYTTALPAEAIAHIRNAYELFPFLNTERKHLDLLIHVFNKAVLPFTKIVSTTPIQAVIIPGNENVKQAALKLQACNLDVRPILYPTVPAGRERLRIVLHAFNAERELDLLFKTLTDSQ